MLFRSQSFYIYTIKHAFGNQHIRLFSILAQLIINYDVSSCYNFKLEELCSLCRIIIGNNNTFEKFNINNMNNTFYIEIDNSLLEKIDDDIIKNKINDNFIKCGSYYVNSKRMLKYANDNNIILE